MWFLSLQKMFFPLFFSLSSFSICVMPNFPKSWDDGLMTYGRHRWQAHSYMPRHTVPLFIQKRVSLNPSACICTFWTQVLGSEGQIQAVFEGQEKSRTHQSQCCLTLIFCCLELSWTLPHDSGEKVFHRQCASQRSNAAVISHGDSTAL